MIDAIQKQQMENETLLTERDTLQALNSIEAHIMINTHDKALDTVNLLTDINKNRDKDISIEEITEYFLTIYDEIIKKQQDMMLFAIKKGVK